MKPAAEHWRLRNEVAAPRRVRLDPRRRRQGELGQLAHTPLRKCVSFCVGAGVEAFN